MPAMVMTGVFGMTDTVGLIGMAGNGESTPAFTRGIGIVIIINSAIDDPDSAWTRETLAAYLGIC